MVLEVSPEGQKDTWICRTDALDDAASAVLPLLMVALLNNEEWGPFPQAGSQSDLQLFCDKSGVNLACHCMGGVGSNAVAEGTYLVTNGCAKLMSVIPYIFLLVKFPLCPARKNQEKCLRPSEETSEDVSDEVSEALQIFRTTGDNSLLPLKHLVDENEKAWRRGELDKGQRPKPAFFGKFEDDKESLRKIMDMAKEDLAWYKSEKVPSLLVEFQKNIKIANYMQNDANNEYRQKHTEECKFIAQCDTMTPEQKWDVGKWFVEYLQFAGYGNAANKGHCWKSIFMLAFPKLCYEGGTANPEFVDDPIRLILEETVFLENFLKSDTQSDKLKRVAAGVGKLSFRLPGLV